MEKGFCRVDLGRVDDSARRNDSFILFVPLDADGQLDPDGEGPPYLFKAVWDGEDWVGEFKERGNTLVWSPIQFGDCRTDLLKAPLRIGGLVSVSTNEGRRTYRVTGIHTMK
jgi:hypothetical protein